MKKLLIGVLASLVIAAALFSCKPKKTTTATGTAPAAQNTVQKTLNGFTFDEATTRIGYFDKNCTMDTKPKSVYAFYDISQIKNIYDLLVSEASPPISKNITGVRIYLGCEDQPPVTPGTRLKIHMYMVSTRARIRNGTTNDPAGHGDKDNIDYYDHTAAYLTSSNAQPFGVAIQDDAKNASDAGAYLYHPDDNVPRGRFPPGTCRDIHYFDNQKTLDYVRKRGHPAIRESEPTIDTTRAEWFDIKFIRSFFKALITPQNKFTGLRIYLGKGKTLKYPEERDLFFFIPTKWDAFKRVNADDYTCLSDLVGKDAIKGYDNGELCPNYCN
jgi:hypothetical protein